jgi:hypothetical protein
MQTSTGLSNSVTGVPEREHYVIEPLRDGFYKRVLNSSGSMFGRPPSPEIYVEPRFTLDPVVSERFTFEFWGVGTMHLIRQLLQEFAEPPEGVHTLLSATSHGESPAWLPRPAR